MIETAQNKSERRPGWRRWLGLGGLVLALGVAGYDAAGAWSLRREVAATARDPQTGVVVGTEALSLDPPTPSAPTVARSGSSPNPAPGTPSAQDRPTSACLLVHGFVGSRKDFGDLGERLAAAGFHVRLARLPGHGTTPRDFARQSPETLYQGLLAEYRELRRHYKAVHVVGFSMGGALATLLASREPVDRLALVAPYFGVTYRWFYVLPPEWWNALFSPVVPYVLKSDRFLQLNKPDGRGNVFSYRLIPTRGVRTLAALGRQARRPETLGRIQCPVLLMISEGDMAASPRAARKAYDALGSPAKQACWVHRRSNHHLFWDWDAEDCKATVVDFLSKPAH